MGFQRTAVFIEKAAFQADYILLRYGGVHSGSCYGNNAD